MKKKTTISIGRWVATFFAVQLLFGAGNSAASIIISVTDNGPALNSATPPSTSLGTVVSAIDPAPGPITYTLSDLDFTSLGGSTTEEIVFQVLFSAVGGDVAYNTIPNGNVYVGPNGQANQIDPGETLRADVSLVSTTFTGGLPSLSVGFTRLSIGGFGLNEAADVVHAGGTINVISQNVGTQMVPFAASSFFELSATSGASNLGGLVAQITAVPEPETALLFAIGLVLMRVLRQRNT